MNYLPAKQLLNTHDAVLLGDNWRLTDTAPDAYATPSDDLQRQAWQQAAVPGTVAQIVHGDINLPGNYDARDWWYQTEFDAPNLNDEPNTRHRLRFEGLATLAEVWLNGEKILHSQNMFRAHVVDVTQLLTSSNQLWICFRSLAQTLEQKRARPRWKTGLTNQQSLRWVRTTLLGHMPGWSPPIQPVGPWRPVLFESIRSVDVMSLDLQTRAEGTTGIVQLQAQIARLSVDVNKATLVVADQRFPITTSTKPTFLQLECTAGIAEIALWWPHTHGQPTLHACHIELIVDNTITRIDCGNIGFKSISVNRRDSKVEFQINGVPIFCRGACWTVNDFLSLSGSEDSLRQALTLARDANLNMLRIGGTMVYESDAFYRLCDELGILVWQDFMFANMDYPIDDSEFRAEVDDEVAQQLSRLQKHVCISAYCGGSEIEQQAAMMGLPSNEWSNDFFDSQLSESCARLHTGIPYFRGSPSEGVLPFQVSTGIAHYYGVGAYRRPLSDVKHAGVRFTTECLGFSNVPEPETMALLLDGTLPPPHHPRWKARLPRDNGAAWDFEDIRDFYLHELFDVDPIKLRCEDVEHYYALARVVSGEAMQRSYAEWRRANNPCSGALMWFFKDLWPGAGWGIVDSENRPKAAYYYLQRAWAPQTVLITDDGLDGLALHIYNDSPCALSASLQLSYWQHGRTNLIDRQIPIQIPAQSSRQLLAEEVVGFFTDSSYAYRFGPAKHDTVMARLTDTSSNTVLGENFYFPSGLTLPLQNASDIVATATLHADGNASLTFTSPALLQNVVLSAPGFFPAKNHFHAAPGHTYTVGFKPHKTGLRKFRVYLEALNLREPLTVRAELVPI